jgi:hypothetical protein
MCPTLFTHNERAVSSDGTALLIYAFLLINNQGNNPDILNNLMLDSAEPNNPPEVTVK